MDKKYEVRAITDRDRYVLTTDFVERTHLTNESPNELNKYTEFRRMMKYPDLNHKKISGIEYEMKTRPEFKGLEDLTAYRDKSWLF